ncbi:MAG: glutamate--cysteine ligase [Burkholderiales bacterium]|nr:glutamate--cysteine ligase [Burkholderiales bacterium]
MQVPHLKTALVGPMAEVERRILDNATRIERWFRLEWQEHTPPFYSSVDLRNSGFKIAPVDTNLYPGGFNNLSREMLPLAVQAAQAAIEKYCADARSLLLIPENHTRNLFYLQNVARLQGILRQTGLEVRLGSLNPEITAPTDFSLPDGSVLTVEPLVRNGDRLGLAGFDPCAILLNNDLSAGIPAVLRGLGSQVLLPPLHAGWAVRRKSNHFRAYDQVVAKFAAEIGIDPWLINPYFGVCGSINFHERTGEECLKGNVESIIPRIRAKYAEYGITEEPFVIVKADAGTYGMGIMSVTSPEEVVGLNRKQRNKMSVVKEGLEVSEVIIQEGVHTIEKVGGASAEPVVYMIDRFVVGSFYRVNTLRSATENLNAPGAHFEPLGIDAAGATPDPEDDPATAHNRFYTYGVISRLAALAASYELEQTASAAG